MQENWQKRKKAGKAGFSLIEVLVASGIFGIGIYALVNLTSFFKQGEQVVSNTLLTSKIILSITEDIMADSIYIIPSERSTLTNAELSDPTFLSLCKDKEFDETTTDEKIRNKVDLRYYDATGMYICREGEASCCEKDSSNPECLYSQDDYKIVQEKQKCYTDGPDAPTGWKHNASCAFKVQFYKTAADISRLGSSHMNESATGAFESFPDLPLSQFHIKISSKLAALSAGQGDGLEKVFCMRPLKSDTIVY